MNNIVMNKFVFILITLSVLFSENRVQASVINNLNLFDKSLPGRSETNVNKQRISARARKKQEAKERKQKKEYKLFVKESQKRSVEIQTPEVQSRMKQNLKDSEARYKSKKKNSNSASKRAGRKYKRNSKG
jgi:hypothetical protein